MTIFIYGVTFIIKIRTVEKVIWIYTTGIVAGVANQILRIVSVKKEKREPMCSHRGVVNGKKTIPFWVF